MQSGLQVSGLHKSYGQRQVVADVSLSAPAGQILGLLGPNGAGKSTTIGMICGLVRADSGRVSVNGASLADDPQAFKRRIGLVPQELALYEDLSALANVELMGALYGVARATIKRRATEALDRVGLADRARDKPASFSGGMKRRLNIACALVHDPDVLLLDEPTAGVDPQSRNAIFDNLEALRQAGKALVYTTHYMEEVERLADQIVIIDHGRVIANGTASELSRLLPAAQTLQMEIDGLVDCALLRNIDGVSDLQLTEGRLSMRITDLNSTLSAVMPVLTQAGVQIRSVNSERARLEDVFLALTGRQLRD